MPSLTLQLLQFKTGVLTKVTDFGIEQLEEVNKKCKKVTDCARVDLRTRTKFY